MLSARGVHHRGSDHFAAQIVQCTNQLIHTTKQGVGKQTIAQGNLYFQRAQAFAMLGNAKRAIRDYTQSIQIFLAHKQPTHTAYFNRSLLHQTDGDVDKALDDVNAALRQEGGSRNESYLHNRTILLRKKNDFLGSHANRQILEKVRKAKKEGKLHEYGKVDGGSVTRRRGKKRNVMNAGEMLYSRFANPEDVIGDTLGDDSMPRMSLLLAGGERTSTVNQNVKKLNTDGIITILEKGPDERTTLEARKIAHTILHFDFFAPLAEDIEALVHLCKRISIKRLPKEEYLFREGDPGDFFYVLYEGAMSITTFGRGQNGGTPKVGGVPAIEKVLKLLHKGDTFGETALKAKHGKRGANAKGGDQDSVLLVIQCADYLAIEEEHEAFMSIQKMALLERR